MRGDSDERSYARAVQARDYANALATAQKSAAKAVDGRRGVWLARAGTAMLMLGRHDEARGSYAAAQELTPLTATDLYNLGICCNETGRYEEAAAHYGGAAALAPRHASTHNNLGKTLNRLGRFDEAEAALRRAL
jgi:protein O-GlcNAc transferase